MTNEQEVEKLADYIAIEINPKLRNLHHSRAHLDANACHLIAEKIILAGWRPPEDFEESSDGNSL